jgi:Sap, sulfolipid-1-addressing protein
VSAAIGEVLPLAAVVAVSPINIIAAVLLLFSKKPVTNAFSYLIGFIAGVAVVLAGVTAMAVAINLSGGSDRGRGASVFLLVLGVCLVIVAVRKFRSRPGSEDDPLTPGWMEGITAFSPTKSLALGITVGAANPKNIAVAVAAAITIASAELSAAMQVWSIVSYVAVASLGVAAPIVVVLVLGERSQGVLNKWKGWLERNNAAIMTVIYLLFGLILIGKGASGL